MKRFCEAFLKLEKGIGGALLLLMLVVVFFATVGRYTGLYNMSWSDEAARYLMIWFVFLLAGLSAFRAVSYTHLDVYKRQDPALNYTDILIKY